MDENLENVTPNNDEQAETPTQQETAAETAEETPKISEEEIAELKKKAELAENYKKRAEKAENENKEFKKASKKAPSQDELTSRDVLYLAKADIHDDDLQEVLDWARFKGVTVADAHKQLKPSLDMRQQERLTQLATQAGRSMRGSNKTSGEDMLRKAEKTGEIPDTEDGLRALAEARLARKRQN